MKKLILASALLIGMCSLAAAAEIFLKFTILPNSELPFYSAPDSSSKPIFIDREIPARMSVGVPDRGKPGAKMALVYLPDDSVLYMPPSHLDSKFVRIDQEYLRRMQAYVQKVVQVPEEQRKEEPAPQPKSTKPIPRAEFIKITNANLDLMDELEASIFLPRKEYEKTRARLFAGLSKYERFISCSEEQFKIRALIAETLIHADLYLTVGDAEELKKVTFSAQMARNSFMKYRDKK